MALPQLTSITLLNVCLLLGACSSKPGFTPCGKDWCKPNTHCGEEQSCQPGCLDDTNCEEGLRCVGDRCLEARTTRPPERDAGCQEACEIDANLPRRRDGGTNDNNDTNHTNNTNNNEDAGCVGCDEEDSSVNDYYSVRCRAYADKIYACFPKSSRDWDDHALICKLIEDTNTCQPAVACALTATCEELRTGQCPSCD